MCIVADYTCHILLQPVGSFHPCGNKVGTFFFYHGMRRSRDHVGHCDKECGTRFWMCSSNKTQHGLDMPRLDQHVANSDLKIKAVFLEPQSGGREPGKVTGRHAELSCVTQLEDETTGFSRVASMVVRGWKPRTTKEKLAMSCRRFRSHIRTNPIVTELHHAKQSHPLRLPQMAQPVLRHSTQFCRDSE